MDSWNGKAKLILAYKSSFKEFDWIIILRLFLPKLSHVRMMLSNNKHINHAYYVLEMKQNLIIYIKAIFLFSLSRAYFTSDDTQYT